jgi:hypothetical protein
MFCRQGRKQVGGGVEDLGRCRGTHEDCRRLIERGGDLKLVEQVDRLDSLQLTSVDTHLSSIYRLMMTTSRPVEEDQGLPKKYDST